MWNNTGSNFEGGFGGGNNDGGFLSSQDQFASPAGHSKARRGVTVVPLTLRAVKKLPDDNPEMFGIQIEKISVVGLIRNVEVSSVSRTYTIDDTTAVMNVIQWEDLGMCDPLMEMTYCQLVGTLRTQQGKRNLIVLSIRPLTDINYITKHILEVIHFPLMIKQVETLNDANERKNTESNSKGLMSNSLVGASGLGGVSGGSFSGLQGLTGQQNMVLQFISNSQDEAGPSRSDIYTLLKGKIGNQQVDKMLDFLSNEGHIYTTIDDDHFKSTEG